MIAENTEAGSSLLVHAPAMITAVATLATALVTALTAMIAQWSRTARTRANLRSDAETLQKLKPGSHVHTALSELIQLEVERLTAQNKRQPRFRIAKTGDFWAGVVLTAVGIFLVIAGIVSGRPIYAGLASVTAAVVLFFAVGFYLLAADQSRKS